jgi:uncharacterized Zn-binding protein involved in type VI secretion
MKLLTKILGLALVLAAATVAYGAAASLSLGSNKLAAGNAAVTSCGVSSLGAIRTVDNNGNVTQVVVNSLPAACAGETLSLTLADGSGASLAAKSATIPTGGGSMTFSGFGTVSAASLSSYKYAVVGA